MKSVTPVRLLGVPQDNNSSYLSGPALAPSRLREAITSDAANMFTETGHDLGDKHVFGDAGDVAVNGLVGKAAFETIYARTGALLREGSSLIGLGGDHSVAYPLISAHADIHHGLDVLHIDAHPDLYDNMLDNPFSHASPFARLMESGKIGRLVQVGIRTLNAHQRAQAARFGVEVHEMLALGDLRTLVFKGPVYLSFDLDALDPAFAPGVSHFEPGGLSTRQVLDIIHHFQGNLVGADVVELNPQRDLLGMTAMVGAKIVKELAGRILDDRQKL